jgi:hypothetical protein
MLARVKKVIRRGGVVRLESGEKQTWEEKVTCMKKGPWATSVQGGSRPYRQSQLHGVKGHRQLKSIHFVPHWQAS